MKHPLTTCLVMGLLSLSALAIEVPAGWQVSQQKDQWTLTPAGLSQGQVFKLLVFREAPLQGQHLEAHLQKFMAADLKTRGKVLQQGKPEAQQDLQVASAVVSNGGRELVLVYSAFPAGEGKAGVTLLISSPDQELLQQHSRTAGQLVGQVLQSYRTVQKRVVPDGLPVGIKPGGKIEAGTYNCVQDFSTIDDISFQLSLYENQEWRLHQQTGHFEYDPQKGALNLSVTLGFYNSQHRPEEFTVYYRDKNNRPAILSHYNSAPIACVYAGKNQQPSPAEEARRKAEEDRKAAEARAFKWFTKPGQGLKMDQIEGIYLHYQTKWNPYSLLYDYVEEHRLLLKDGWMYDKLEVSPADLDVKASRKNEAMHWFKWKKQGDKLVYQDPDSGKWETVPGAKVGAAKKGEKLSGSFMYLQNNSNITSGGSVYRESYAFDGKGGFALSSSSGLFSGGMPGYSGSATSYTNHEGTTHSFSTGTPDGFAGGGNNQQNPNDDLHGTYLLDGYTLELRTKSGKVVRKLFFFPNSKKRDGVVIDGITYWLQD